MNKELEGILSLLDKNEMRRLQKAAKDKNMDKIYDWARQLEIQLLQRYERNFEKELAESIDNFILTIVYTLHFHDSTRFGNKRIKEFMRDLLETIDMFKRGEAKPEDYQKALKEDGIIVKRKDDE